MRKLFKICIYTFVIFGILILSNNVKAIELRGIEKIKWEKTCSLEEYGYVNVTLNLNYNATTGVTTLDSMSYTTHLNKLAYPTLKVTKIITSPGIRSVVHPNTSGVKVTIYYNPIPGYINDYSKVFNFTSTQLNI